MSSDGENEVIHVHKNYNRPDFYLLWLLIPSIVFVLIVAGLLRLFLDKNAEGLASTSESEVIAMDNELTTIVVGGKEILVEVASDDLTRQKGLSGRQSLGENVGMLFVFEAQNVRPGFWMKDMLIPIDIVWINDGEIIQINKDVQPEPGVSDRNLALYVPSGPIDYVLEVNAGFCERNLIEVGDGVNL